MASPLFHWKRFVALGLLVAAIAAVLFARAVARSRVPLTAEVSVTLGLAMLLLMPYVLPKMHERYFYAADVTAIVFAFFFQGVSSCRFWWDSRRSSPT